MRKGGSGRDRRARERERGLSISYGQRGSCIDMGVSLNRNRPVASDSYSKTENIEIYTHLKISEKEKKCDYVSHALRLQVRLQNFYIHSLLSVRWVEVQRENLSYSMSLKS